MISKLYIENLILIEKTTIEFGAHLNILTGETGSGKSVILAALALIMGERADLEQIGKWGETAIVEAQIEEHLIRREIHSSGKNRCFLDGHLITLSLLKQFIGTQIEIVDQNTSQKLFSSSFQRAKLDLFGGLTLIASQLADCFRQQMDLKEKCNALQIRLQNQERDRQWAESHLQSIQEVDWKENEEEHLAQEQQRLSHAEELTLSIQEIISAWSENSFLKRIIQQLQTSSRLDPQLEPIVSSIKNSALELDEAERQLRSYLSRLEEIDSSKLPLIDARIGSIESLKKKFGSSWEEVEKKKREFLSALTSQSAWEEELKELTEQMKEAEEKTASLADMLSSKRKNASLLFTQAIVSELKSLNLPDAQLEIYIEKGTLTSDGYDQIRYFFSANPGHLPAPLEKCASGGELSRLLFAIQTTLAKKEQNRCLIFDEIDSNVGGYTASILGEKLKLLAEHRQVIAVTHFAQVARSAKDHFSVSKQKASILIERLSSMERENEYRRMAGELK